MRLPERPQNLAGLDLMTRLKEYADGLKSWFPDRELGLHERSACHELYSNLIALVERCLHPLMDRVTSREMDAFTMHDHGHGLKVAHLMWHIIQLKRRDALSPGEIALLVVSAHLHDLGMGLSKDEREARLRPESDLWDKIDTDSLYQQALDRLAEIAKITEASQAVRAEAIYQVQQAQEALLCLDCRERHATRDRYLEIIRNLEQMHHQDAIHIPDIRAALSFDGDSYLEKLIDVCVSHNEDAHVLMDRDPANFDQWRFPTQYPIGCCLADVRFVSAVLRLADILDFDRERTPSVLYYYLLPRSADPSENVSVREWSKHLSISNWEIEADKVVFRGRSTSALIHHAIVEFCHTIESEISRTRGIFADEEWPICVKPNVEAVIETSGYRYIPYRFSLDEERIYELLMGRNIYERPLDALRELVQNAVDACLLRDALMRSYDDSIRPNNNRRITIQYADASAQQSGPMLSVIDTGIGMDRYIIENYFFKVGRSYYKSSDFIKIRSQLRALELDFQPVSEFGIGFMAIFMLGNKVEVETALSLPVRQDAQRRLLQIDGVGRLIEVKEDPNTSIPRFQGTRVSVRLATRVSKVAAPSWDQVETYLQRMCKNLPYPLLLQHLTATGTVETEIIPEGLKVQVPEHLKAAAITIPVNDVENGLRGEVVLIRGPEAEPVEEALASTKPVFEEQQDRYGSALLLRGGFAIGLVPGLPDSYTNKSYARIEVCKDLEHPRSLPTTNLARSRLVQEPQVEAAVFRNWLDHLFRALDEVEARPIGSPLIDNSLLRSAKWLEQYSAYDLYRLARSCWISRFRDAEMARAAVTKWENGEADSPDTKLSSSRLDWCLFNLILPRIAKLTVKGRGFYCFLPPRQDWKGELMSWRTFVTDGLRWGPFVQFGSKISDFLYITDSSTRAPFLNECHQNKFTGFLNEEIDELIEIFGNLIYKSHSKEQMQLPSSDIELLSRASAVAGDLKIAWFDHRRTVSELTGAGSSSELICG